ncbi:unnamed protein product [Linum tenue]|uniref:EF-hand domain-containing protein n=1 Tax=Linum tenue TaxID=586396 RepID=A0AAV0LZP0_9ROSI|nr:unnamed protein product [Linum tenue]
MKVFKIITNPRSLSPKRLFRSSKKTKSSSSSPAVSRSDPSSFADSSSAAATPKSVLPQSSSGDWSSDLSELTYLELQHAFRIIDRDNDGVVSKSELAALLGRLGSSDEVAAAMLSEVGRAEGDDDDGCVTVEALMGRVGPAGWEPAGRDELKETFGFFDADRDGRITAEELLLGLSAIGESECTLEECRRMIAEVDRNGDGFVCLEDFCRMMDLQR